MKIGVSILVEAFLSLPISLSVFIWAPGRSACAQETQDPVLVGAGDIARCSATGDNVYDRGSAAEFENCYEPSWGSHLERTKPSLGNPEYHAPAKDSVAQAYKELTLTPP